MGSSFAAWCPITQISSKLRTTTLWTQKPFPRKYWTSNLNSCSLAKHGDLESFGANPKLHTCWVSRFSSVKKVNLELFYILYKINVIRYTKEICIQTSRQMLNPVPLGFQRSWEGTWTISECREYSSCIIQNLGVYEDSMIKLKLSFDELMNWKSC